MPKKDCWGTTCPNCKDHYLQYTYIRLGRAGVAIKVGLYCINCGSFYSLPEDALELEQEKAYEIIADMDKNQSIINDADE